MHFGQLVKQYREDHKWSQTECSHRAGMKVQQWSTMEAKVANPSSSTLEKVAMAFEITVDELRFLSGIATGAKAQDDELLAFLSRQEAKIAASDRTRFRKMVMYTAEVIANNFQPA